MRYNAAYYRMLLLEQAESQTLMSTQDEIGPGVYYSWHGDRDILVVTVTSISRVSVDAFVDFMVQTLIDWPEGKPFLCAQEFAADITVTPYLRERLGDVVRVNRSDISGRNAFATRNLAAHVIFDVMFRTIDNIFPRMEKRTFLDMDSALAWILDNYTD